MRYILKTHQDEALYLAAFYRNPRQVCLFTPFLEDACSYKDKSMALDSARHLKDLFDIDAELLNSPEND
jgi:hypothetical protein